MAQVVGSLPGIIRNDHRLYEGNLIYYFQIVFTRAQNLRHPYHNFRHMFHVLWLCYQACAYYGDILSPRQMRRLLVAAVFHDFNHSGLLGDDDLNIQRAVRGFLKYAAPEDRDPESIAEITSLIGVTQFPYTVASETLSLSGQIIRDADMSQAFGGAWIQQVIFGLAAEWGQKPLDVLKAQEAFHRKLVFHTDWARAIFSKEDIERKIREARELLELLETPLSPN